MQLDRRRCEQGKSRQMSLSADRKQEIVSKFARGQADTGSPEVQVALLSARISHLTEHFRSHAHDHHSRRGLMKLVGRRRRLLTFLKSNDVGRYAQLISELGIRK